MAENSNIEWCDHTFNPWMGCTRVSEGCRNCYAEFMMDHRLGRVEWGPGKPRVRTSEKNWRQPLRWNQQAQQAGERHRVFCASLADVFDHEVAQAWRSDLWELIESCLHLDWLLLTKRPQNVPGMVPPEWMEGCWPAHVWLGTTVENQQAADERVPLLLACPAPVRFLSCEPLLGPVNLLDQPWWDHRHSYDFYPDGMFTAPINWVIAGGESGLDARPMHPDWARSLRDQCQGAGVLFLYKQWGEWVPSPMCGGPGKLPDTGRYSWFEDHVCMVRVGKKVAGRMLDGQEHTEFPKSPAQEG